MWDYISSVHGKYTRFLFKISLQQTMKQITIFYLIADCEILNKLKNSKIFNIHLIHLGHKFSIAVL